MATNINFSEKEKVEAYYEKNHWKITFKRMLKDWILYDRTVRPIAPHDPARSFHIYIAFRREFP